ncbi:replication initiator protein/RepA-like protein [Staphylococcus epidermidis]|uniref:replication initiator protein A n=1 Tax=Staphylococcus epidermidis TaxID=1282 RepID=UPI0002F8ABBE|nr:replication initiator protein A [Staphylococcus epidermidis]QGY86821.1 replication initiator protein A [Staphylococcus epidermidis]
MSEQRFNIQQQYREKFYQLPKVFFTNDKYIQLSNDAKIAYALLKDRLELSIKNNWFDENGDIFFIYTNEKLKNILNCHNAKLIKIKKELTKANLLEQIRCGQGKPNKLYLMNPAITKEDIYEIKKQEESIDEPHHDAEVRKSNFKKFENRISRSSKIEFQEVRKSNTNDTEFSDTEFSDTEFSDTHDMNDIHNIKNKSNTVFHSNHSNHQSQTSDILSKQEEARYELQEFPEHLAKYLMNYSLSEIQIIKGIILKAKRSFHDERADEIVMPYTLEDIEDELIDVLKRFRIIIKKKNESVQSMQSYLMRCIKSEFEEIHVLTKRQQNMPKYNIFNT